MARNPGHDLLTIPDADNAARQQFVLALKQQLQSSRPRLRTLYEAEIKSNERETAREILNGLYSNEKYRTICCLRRIAQQIMWRSVAAPIEKNAAVLARKFQHYVARTNKAGSLTLDPDIEIPESLRRVDVHLQPGGYLRNETDRDVLAGALYAAGGALYSQGQNIGARESKAGVIMRYIDERYHRNALRPGNA